ncbi:hypothetical protein BOSE127_30224 [Bosea sp. 127]|nr:hypothetical protein BOSE127_30224 [Bosea sp. 127]
MPDAAALFHRSSVLPEGRRQMGRGAEGVHDRDGRVMISSKRCRLSPSPRLRWGGLGWGAVPLGEAMKGRVPAFRPPIPNPFPPQAGGGGKPPSLTLPHRKRGEGNNDRQAARKRRLFCPRSAGRRPARGLRRRGRGRRGAG